MSDGNRVLGETGELLQADQGWHLEDHDNDDGPVILHVKCGAYICDLNRKYPMCRVCGAEMPASMISGFTMLNWDKVGSDEYFVQPGCESADFIYNGHERVVLRETLAALQDKVQNLHLMEETVLERVVKKYLTKEKS